MCGIFAILNQNKIDQTVKSAFELGKARGPENSKLVNYDDFIIGYHRLAINGLDTESNQPLVHNNIILICNGEIYNYKNLG